MSNVTAPGPRYFDHAQRDRRTGDSGSGAFVPLVYFMSSVAQSVSGSGVGHDAVVVVTAVASVAMRTLEPLVRSARTEDRRRVADGDLLNGLTT